MTGRHPDIDHDQIRPLRADQREEAGRISGLAGDLEALPLEESGHALAQQDVASARTTRTGWPAPPGPLGASGDAGRWLDWRGEITSLVCR
jgi:hypothetical protein